MTIEDVLSSLYRRRVLFVVTLLLCLGLTVAVTYAVPKTYRAKAVLSVEIGDSIDPASIEQLTRTYATLAANPNVVDNVRQRLGDGSSRSSILDRMAFRPVERTQLLEISADHGTPEQAARLVNLYSETFAERTTASGGAEQTTGEIVIAEAAALPTDPVKPNPPLYLGLGAIISVALAFGTVLLRDRLDQRVAVDEEEDTALGLPLLARVPSVARDNDVGAFSDAFRLLKANLDFIRDDDLDVLVITSPGSTEGKSTTALNLARAAAEDGERVLLIEGDLRRPSLEQTAGPRVPKRHALGLANYLAGGTDLEEIVDTHPALPQLDLVWSGPVMPHPTPLLHSDRLEQLLARFRSQYDRVIIDTPPVFVSADTKLLAAQADGVIYVVDAERTKPAPARTGLNQLRRVNPRVLGIVLNRAKVPVLEGYYGGDARELVRDGGTPSGHS